MVTIRFKSEPDRVNGLYCLALNGRVRCLPHGLFEIQPYLLEHLDREAIRYEIVTEDILSEVEKVRNIPAASIQ